MEHLTEWRDGAENPGFKKRKIQIYHSLNKNQQKIIEWEKKNSKFHRVRRTRFNFFFFIYFILKVIVSTSLFSATSIACILIEVFNSNMVKTLHIYTVKTDDLYTSKYSYIYMYIIYCKLLIENTKKWDLALHSGIVEMKGNKEKKNWDICVCTC